MIATAPGALTDNLLAYRVTIDDMSCIVFAPTPAKARWMAIKSYWEAGYGRPRVWPRPSAVRTPHYDCHPASDRDYGRTHTEGSL